MDNLDPATAASLDDLAACLRHIHLLADKPTYRALEQRTGRENGFLPGSRWRRTRLTRTVVSDVLLGRKFPGKAFLLTFVDACGIDLEADRRWEQAWDRLAPQYQQVAGELEKLGHENEELQHQLEELRQQLAAAEQRAEAAQALADKATAAIHASKAVPLQSRQEAQPGQPSWAAHENPEATRASLESAAVGVSLDDPGAVATLLDRLRDAGALEQADALADRAAAGVSLDDPAAVARLLDRLRDAGALEQADALADRAAAGVSLDDPAAVAGLLDSLGDAGALEQADALAYRAAAHVSLEDPAAVAKLLDSLKMRLETVEAIAMLLARIDDQPRRRGAAWRRSGPGA